MLVRLTEDTNFTTVDVFGYSTQRVHDYLRECLSVKLDDDTVISFFEPGTNYFLRGLTPFVASKLGEAKLNVEWQSIPRVPRQPRPVQPTFCRHLQGWVVGEMLKHKYGVLNVATRFGKSYIYAAWYLAVGRPMLAVFVPTEAIARQMRDEISKVIGEPVGIVCSSVQKTPDWQNFTVIVENSLFMRDDAKTGEIKPEHIPYLAACEARIRDECHRHGTMMVMVYMAMPNCIWSWGGSATPVVDDALQNWYLFGWHGPMRVQVSARTAADYGIIAPAQIAWVRHKQPPLLEMREWHDTYYSGIAANFDRNMLIARIACKLIAMGKQGLIFVNYAEQGQRIANNIRGSYVVATKLISNEEAENIKLAFNQSDIKCVLTTKKWREGITFKCDFAINAEGMKADHVTVQKLGRGLIPKENGKPLLWIDIDDYGIPVLRKHATERSECYDSEGWPQHFFSNIESFEQGIGALL